MQTLPRNIVKALEDLKKRYPFYVTAKRINGRYYLYKEIGVWDKTEKKERIVSEYLGRITDDGNYIKKKLSAKDDIENAKALIASHGGEIIWHNPEENRDIGPKQTPAVPSRKTPGSEENLKILTALSMNSRISMKRLSEIAGINESTAHYKVSALEKKFGIRYISEIDTEKLGFTTYLILVKFEEGLPTSKEAVEVLKKEPRIQFAAATKGDFDMVIYLLDENSRSAEDNLWKIMSEGGLENYKAKWNLVPFGQIGSVVPLREEFFTGVLQDKLPSRKPEKNTSNQINLRNREFLLLKELNTDAAVDFTEVDSKHGLVKGSSRYSYHKLKESGILIRTTITMENLPMRYLGMLIVETESPKEVKKTRHKLLLDELEYGYIASKYALMGNIGMPEGIMLFAPIVNEGDLDNFADHLKSEFKGTVVRTLIATEILVGSLCYRRPDMAHFKRYSYLVENGYLERKALVNYE